MSSTGTLVGRARLVDLRVIDRVLAVLLTVAALGDTISQPHRVLGPLAVTSLFALTGSVAWRRLNPVIATLIAIAGLIAFQQASVYAGDGAFELTAIALNFYMLGRRRGGRGSVVILACVFASWLAAAAVISYSTAGGSVSEVLGVWALFGGLSFAAGRILATRSALTRQLETKVAQLQDEQEARARRAAAEERYRVARELHDVIAHSLSVMVVQTSAARRVARLDLHAALTALQVVERLGREALVELRLIVGVLRRGSDDLAVSVVPGLAQLDALADRARAAGLLLEVCVEGQGKSLSPGLDLVAYRVVQEALTNVIKHAGPLPVMARVSMRFGADELELKVVDSGSGPAAGRGRCESGHGLLGMGERVCLYGGELRAGPRANGGFEVTARVPFDGFDPPAQVRMLAPSSNNRTVAATGGLRWPWLDPLLATALLIVFEVAVATSRHRHGPIVLNMIAVGAMALAGLWRRRSPLLFLIVFGTVAVVMNKYLTALTNSTLAGPAILLLPTYAVAAWGGRRKAILGLAIFVGSAGVGDLIGHHGTVGNFAGAAFPIIAAWAAGRAIRSRRELISALARTSAQLAAEREDRVRLAVTGERTRIASELHAAVAHSLAAMVVQAEAARSLLERDSDGSDIAMAAVEHTGRGVLVEMRRILGALRHDGDNCELEPQPGVDQVFTLIQRARENGQSVELTIDGTPGTLAPRVDLGIYRILEEALRSARQPPAVAVRVILQFGEDDLELRLTGRCGGPSRWPTEAMRERLTLCSGELHAGRQDAEDWQFVARIPRGLQGTSA